jgi:hypothetical protein
LLSPKLVLGSLHLNSRACIITEEEEEEEEEQEQEEEQSAGRPQSLAQKSWL